VLVEVRTDFKVRHGALNYVHTLLEWCALHTDEIAYGETHCKFKLSTVYQHSAALVNRLLDVPVGHTKELLDILLGVVPDIYCRVFKEFRAFGVLLAGDVEDVGDAAFNEAARLETAHKVADEQPLPHRIDVVRLEQTVVLAAAELHVWEAGA